MKIFRVAVIDDHPLVVEGICLILREAGHHPVDKVPSSAALVSWLTQQCVDAVTLDIGMPGLNGIELTRQIRAVSPQVAVLIVTQQSDKAYLRAAIQAGALGFVSKQAAAKELIHALTTAMKGRLYISPQVLDASPDARAVLKKLLQGQRELLTTRQQVVLQHIAEGMTMKEIALAMKISVKTVEFHKRALTETLGVCSTAELTKYAIAHGHTYMPA